MRRTLVFALALLATMTVAAAPSRKVLIEKNVDQLVALFNDGVAVEHPKYRRIEFGKIFGSDQEDAIALFSLEGFHGGNEDAEYLAFFQSVEQVQIAGRTTRLFRLVAVTKIGGRSWRFFDWKTIKLGSGFVTLSGAKYGPEDAACCPSVPILVTFRIKEGFISESK
ncbi:MAG: hypothetical protein ABSG80_16695 [Verrucomicrobiota bacterium]|jgi:hypothetical protein